MSTLAILDARLSPVTVLQMGENTAEAMRYAAISCDSAANAEAFSGPTCASQAAGQAHNRTILCGKRRQSCNYLFAHGHRVHCAAPHYNISLAAPSGAVWLGSINLPATPMGLLGKIHSVFARSMLHITL